MLLLIMAYSFFPIFYFFIYTNLIYQPSEWRVCQRLCLPLSVVHQNIQNVMHRAPLTTTTDTINETNGGHARDKFTTHDRVRACVGNVLTTHDTLQVTMLYVNKTMASLRMTRLACCGVFTCCKTPHNSTVVDVPGKHSLRQRQRQR